jgi:hypothetical protein
MMQITEKLDGTWRYDFSDPDLGAANGVAQTRDEAKVFLYCAMVETLGLSQALGVEVDVQAMRDDPASYASNISDDIISWVQE